MLRRWYGGDRGNTGGQRTYRAYYPYYPYRTYSPYDSYRAYHPYQRHAQQLTHNKRGGTASLKKKTVAYAMGSQVAKAEHYHFRHTVRAEEMTRQRHNSVSAETAIKQTSRDTTHTLSLGTPFDPRSPSTWTLYSQMLPFVFSEAPAAASHGISAPRRRDDDAGM
jgi:hypothetical protein